MMFKTLLQQEVAFFDDKENSTGALCARLSGEAAAVQGVSIKLLIVSQYVNADKQLRKSS